MIGIESAGQRPEGRQDQLARRRHETAPRDVAPAHPHAQFRVEMPRKFGPCLARCGLVSQHQPIDHRLGQDGAAAAIDQPGPACAIMIASDPAPRRRTGQRAQRVLRRRGQPIAPGIVVETVAQAPHFARARRRDDRVEIDQGGERIIGRQHLPVRREPARFLEMQVRHQQRAPRRPEQRTATQGKQLITGERKGNHSHAYVVAPAPKQPRQSACAKPPRA